MLKKLLRYIIILLLIDFNLSMINHYQSRSLFPSSYIKSIIPNVSIFTIKKRKNLFKSFKARAYNRNKLTLKNIPTQNPPVIENNQNSQNQRPQQPNYKRSKRLKKYYSGYPESFISIVM